MAKADPLGVPSTLGLTNPFSITPAFQECPDELQQPLVRDPFGDLPHPLVVIDPIEEFLQIEIHAPAVALSDICANFGRRRQSVVFASSILD